MDLWFRKFPKRDLGNQVQAQGSGLQRRKVTILESSHDWSQIACGTFQRARYSVGVLWLIEIDMDEAIISQRALGIERISRLALSLSC